jgi:hypothetical protein
MLGLDFHEGFSPKGCPFSIDGPAITAAAGTQMYEIEMVTPGGDIVTVNECQNTDLFWAMRGVSYWMFNLRVSNTQ